MKNIIIIVLGIAVNILIYLYSQATKGDINMIVPSIYLFFIIPLLLAVMVISSIVYNYVKRKSKAHLLSKSLIASFLLLIPVLQLIFFNEVYAK